MTINLNSVFRTKILTTRGTVFGMEHRKFLFFQEPIALGKRGIRMCRIERNWETWYITKMISTIIHSKGQ